jgi:type IV pilus assembly protein PilC
MPQFHYRGAQPDGTVVSDRIEGDSEPAVRAQLEGQGLLIFKLKGAGAGLKLPLAWWGRGRLSLREFLVFNQEFLALVKAGLPFLKIFDLLAERAVSPDLQAALRGVRADIRGGSSISDALSRYPHYFSDLYRASVRSGERTGALAEVLKRYIAHLKLVIAVREKVVKALAYPAFLIVVGAAVVLFLLLYVVPTFSEIYGQNKAALPGPTRMLLTVVETGTRWLPWLVGGALALTILLAQWLRTPWFRAQLDRLGLHLPVIGDVLLKNQIVRFTRTLSTILAGGIPLLTALKLSSGTLTNSVIAQAVLRATDRVREGTRLAAALREEQFLPPMTLEMIEVGETTGALEGMLQDVAEFHEGELDLRLSQLTTWIEPMLLLIMGLIVGGIVIVMYLPVFEIAGTV